MSFSTFAIRSVGVIGTAMALREINLHSQEHASFKTRNQIATNMTDLLLKHSVATDGTQFTNSLQRDYLEWRMDDKTVPTAQYAKNRVEGLASGLLKFGIPLGLAATAMLAKSNSTSKLRLYKGYVPKVFAGAAAIGLGLIAATSFSANVLGWGKNHPKGFYP